MTLRLGMTDAHMTPSTGSAATSLPRGLPPYEVLRGEVLHGDDFTPTQIDQWFNDEAEAYADLTKAEPQPHRYYYHTLNRLVHYQYLPKTRFRHVLGFGAADGEEIRPLLDQVDRVTVVEPSGQFVRETLGGRPIEFVKPRADGVLPFADATFDLVTCFGVLHHIPNVSKVVQEIARCTAPSGYFCLREPTTSMGGWWNNRPGLTRHERGIHMPLLEKMVKDAGFEVLVRRRVMSPFLPRISNLLRRDYCNSPSMIAVDRALCSLLAFGQKYHAEGVLAKLRPGAAAFVLRRVK